MLPGSKRERKSDLGDTFKMLASFLFVFNMDVCRITAEQFPGMSEDLTRRRRVTSAQFNDVWQIVLDKMLGAGLVPYLTLVR